MYLILTEEVTVIFKSECFFANVLRTLKSTNRTKSLNKTKDLMLGTRNYPSILFSHLQLINQKQVNLLRFSILSGVNLFGLRLKPIRLGRFLYSVTVASQKSTATFHPNTSKQLLPSQICKRISCSFSELTTPD